MNGKKSKRLRKTLSKILGQAPRKAYGHVRFVAEHLSIPDKNTKQEHAITHWKEFTTEGAPATDQWRAFKRSLKRGDIVP